MKGSLEDEVRFKLSMGARVLREQEGIGCMYIRGAGFRALRVQGVWVSRVSKQRVNERRYGCSFGEENEAADQEKRDNDRQQPILVSYLQKFPHFGASGLVGHVVLFSILL